MLKNVLVLLATALTISHKISAMESDINKAASRGWDARVKHLLENEAADLNARDRNGNTPLHNAAKKGYSGVMHVLLKSRGRGGQQEIDVNAVNNDNDTPLHLVAAAELKIERLRDLIYILVGAGARPTLLNGKGLSPVHIVLLRHCVELLRYMFDTAEATKIETGVNTLTAEGKTPLMLAAQAGDIAVMRELLKRDAAVNEIFWPKNANPLKSSGKTALDMARAGGGEYARTDVIQLLLEHGARPAPKAQHDRLISIISQSRPVESPKNMGGSRAVQRKKKEINKKAVARTNLSASTSSLETKVGLMASLELPLAASLDSLSLNQR